MHNVWETPLGQQKLAEIRVFDEKVRESAEAARLEGSARARQLVMQRQYASAKPSRLRSDFNPTDSSADAELVSSLTTMRSRSRALVRDSNFARHARRLVTNNVIGTGIGLQGAVKNAAGVRNARINSEIETSFAKWSRGKYCHKGRTLAFSQIERWAMSQVFETGECLVRLWPDDQGMGVPLALEVIEPERLADEFTSPQVSAETGNEVRMGVEVDEFFAPVAYYIRDRHPNEFRFRGGAANALRRIPASQIIHLKICDRWPQTRGEPWLCSAISRNHDMDGYVEAELARARSQATIVAAIETPESIDSFGEVGPDGSAAMETEPGLIKRLNPGEKLQGGPTGSPNPELGGFMRFLIREFAVGIGVSYESLSRDYSQSNYSSSRMALLDDRDVWKFLQAWFITDFREKIHEAFMDQAILANAFASIKMGAYALNPFLYQAVRYKPRGWSWVDPTKEVEAFKEAVKGGFTTNTAVIAATGGGQDIDDVLEERAQELEAMDEHGLVFETSPEFYMKEAEPETPAGTAPKAPPAPDEDDVDDEKAGKKSAAPVLSIAR